MMKILQIINSDGWYMAFKFEGLDEFYEELKCWALCEESGNTFVTGMMGSGSGILVPCHTVEGYQNYEYSYFMVKKRAQKA